MCVLCECAYETLHDIIIFVRRIYARTHARTHKRTWIYLAGICWIIAQVHDRSGMGGSGPKTTTKNKRDLD